MASSAKTLGFSWSATQRSAQPNLGLGTPEGLLQLANHMRLVAPRGVVAVFLDLPTWGTSWDSYGRSYESPCGDLSFADVRVDNAQLEGLMRFWKMVEDQDSELALFYVKGFHLAHYPPLRSFLIDRSLRLYRSVVPLCLDGFAFQALKLYH